MQVAGSKDGGTDRHPGSEMGIPAEREGRLLEQVECGRRRAAKLDARAYGCRQALGRAIWGSKLSRISTGAEFFRSPVNVVLTIATR
jgi:hypothetical protein